MVMNLRNSILFILCLLLVGLITACRPRQTISGEKISTATPVHPLEIEAPVITQNTPPGLLFGTPTIEPCDRMEFVTDVTVPAGSVLAAGAHFTKTWKVRNIGSCIWNQKYSFVFLDGTAMGSGTNIPLQNITSVVPGAESEVSLELVAPDLPGRYQGNWTLRSGFTGLNFPQILTVNIEVVNMTTDPNSFAGLICNAQWFSNGNSTPCIVTPTNQGGGVSYSNAPLMEDGSEENEPALVLALAPGGDSRIIGRFAPVFVQPGSHLRGVYSCYAQSPACKVRLRITYQVDGGVETQIGEWMETFDGTFSDIEIDLAPFGLENQYVYFTFYFEANGSAEQNQVFFLAPRITLQ
jgi:hypothetical protein